MDSETKMLLVGFATLGVGIALGWCLKMQVRRGQMRQSQAGKPVVSGSPQATFMIPTGVAPAGCGCRSS